MTFLDDFISSLALMDRSPADNCWKLSIAKHTKEYEKENSVLVLGEFAILGNKMS